MKHSIPCSRLNSALLPSWSATKSPSAHPTDSHTPPGYSRCSEHLTVYAFALTIKACSANLAICPRTSPHAFFALPQWQIIVSATCLFQGIDKENNAAYALPSAVCMLRLRVCNPHCDRIAENLTAPGKRQSDCWNFYRLYLFGNQYKLNSSGNQKSGLDQLLLNFPKD